MSAGFKSDERNKWCGKQTWASCSRKWGEEGQCLWRAVIPYEYKVNKNGQTKLVHHCTYFGNGHFHIHGGMKGGNGGK